MTAHSRLACIEGPLTRGDLPAHRRADIIMPISPCREAEPQPAPFRVPLAEAAVIKEGRS